MKPSRDISRLIEIMAALRTPGSGCPWDLEQDFSTIAPYTIEEAYEVADAIDRGDMVDLKQELGDLLLQSVYHARMAEELKLFDFGDVVEAITRKMIRRHPHVFGDEKVRSAGMAKGAWERIKTREKAEAAAERESVPNESSVLEGIPAALPGLMTAAKLQAKAARVGFDWDNVHAVIAKIREELDEVELEIAGTSSQNRLAEEVGDVLFAVANLARHLHLDAEGAIRSANAKFRRRFAHVEKRLSEAGRTPDEADLAELEILWTEAKATEQSI